MLGLVNDCFRFVIGYFEVISASSPHIYHSALVLAPKDSIVRNLYGSQANPLARIVCGALISWDMHTAAKICDSKIDQAVWSPCDRFIAVTYVNTMTVDILDSVTLQRLQTLESPEDAFTSHKALVFSPDSHILTCSSNGIHRAWSSRELFVISWDLQTGSITSTIRQRTPDRLVHREPSITYSANGKTAGILYQHFLSPQYISIFIFDIASNTFLHSHLLNGHPLLQNCNIWTEGQSLRFITYETAAITIWEVKFTSNAPPTKVNTLPLLERPSNITGGEFEVQFSPASSRLACASQNSVLVWDVCNSRYLLHYKGGARFSKGMSFSSDGRFLACPTTKSNIYLWKESPTGFILHGTLTPSAAHPSSLLSQNGESILTYGGHTIQLWHATEQFPTTPPSDSSQAPQRIGDFILDLSPDLMLAAITTQKDNVVTILNLNSGVPQSTIDTGMEVYGLGVIKNTVVVIGCWEAGTWNLPIGDGTPGARAGREDCSWTSHLKCKQVNKNMAGASVSPDFRYIALTVQSNWSTYLCIYDTSTRGNIWCTTTHGPESITGFSLDGNKLWCIRDGGMGESEVLGVGMRGLYRHNIDFGYIKHSPEGCPWESSYGYQVTDDWWIIGPGGKRLLMLPPTWRSGPLRRLWKGRFLALLHHQIPEPVILELL